MEHREGPVGIAKPAIVWTWVWLAAKIVTGTTALASAILLATNDFVGFATALRVMSIASLCALALYIVAGVLNLIWLYRVAAVNRRMTGGATTAPGWAVGWFFVPVAAWWMPFRAVREAWQVASRPAGWRDAPVAPLLRLWWALWLAVTFLNLGTTLLRLPPHSPDRSILIFAIGALVAVLSVPLTIAWTRIVREISRAHAGLPVA